MINKDKIWFPRINDICMPSLIVTNFAFVLVVGGIPEKRSLQLNGLLEAAYASYPKVMGLAPVCFGCVM